MTTRPVIFISAVSKELKTARDHVAKTLLSLGYEPKWQDIAPTETGDLRGVLRKWVDESQAVVQLIGQCYGHEAPQPDPQFGRCSYTQYEALYAKSRGKKVWYLPVGPGYACDTCTTEPDELRQLQADYLQRIRAQGDLRHGFTSPTELEIVVLKLRDDLARLRRRSYQWAIAVLILLLLIAGGVVWLQRGQQQTHQTQEKSLHNDDKLQEAIADVKQAVAISIKGGSEETLTQEYDTALRFIATRRGIPIARLHDLMEANATAALGDPTLSALDKIQALKEAGQFIQARDFALDQATKMQANRQKASREEILLWMEATQSEMILGRYPQALAHSKKAASLADRRIDFTTWAEARELLGHAKLQMSFNSEALSLFEEVVSLRAALVGINAPETLNSRNNLACALNALGRYSEAEMINRAVMLANEHTLGATHPDTLMSRMNLANTLLSQGKYKQAEAEHQTVLAIKQHVLGEEHPDTYISLVNVAGSLQGQGKYAEAEIRYKKGFDFLRRVLGAEHPDTLNCRANMANSLASQSKYNEAESEHRMILAVRQRVLGEKHSETLMSRMNLAILLKNQKQYPLAEAEYRALTDLLGQTLGREHPNTLKVRCNLATVLRQQGRYSEAETEHRVVLAIQERTLGIEHTDTLMNRMNLANTLYSQGKHAAAEAEHRAVLAIQERVLGAEHPDTLMSLFNLALNHEDQGQLPEAQALMQRAEAGMTKVLGEDHPFSQKAKAGLERIQGKIDAAEGEPPGK